jgi:hypothetical protein
MMHVETAPDQCGLSFAELEIDSRTPEMISRTLDLPPHPDNAFRRGFNSSS